MDCDVVVIGAGPGGCATAYHLQQAGWQVALVERRTYPAEKLCGEFLSADGVASLKRLGLPEPAARRGAPSIDEVLISSASGRSWQTPLPVPGLGWSRRSLDNALLERCCRVGVNVMQGLRIHGVHGSDDHGYYVYGRSAAGQRALRARLVVGAFGKQSGLHRQLRGHIPPASHRLMALKLHLPGGYTSGRVELHMFPGGYVGLCEIEGGQTNLCLLIETAVFQHVGRNHERLCQERLALNPLLRQRLDSLRPAWHEVVAVANLTFGSHPRSVGSVLMVGDAAASISPLCGNGMSMALRSGEILAPLVHRFLSGRLTAQALQQAYGQQWHREFSRRLWLGGALQQLFLNASLGQAAMMLLHRFPSLGQRLIRWTRGAPPARLSDDDFL